MSSVGRLTFLYPRLARAALGSATPSVPCRRRTITDQRVRNKGTFGARVGKGVEPMSWEERQKKAQQEAEDEDEDEVNTELMSNVTKTEKVKQAEMKTPDKTSKAGKTLGTPPSKSEVKQAADKEVAEDTEPIAMPPPDLSATSKEEPSPSPLDPSKPAKALQDTPPSSKQPTDGQQSQASAEGENASKSASASNTGATAQGEAGADKEGDAEEERARQTRQEAKQGGPLEAVLQMPPPEEVARQHPSMSPPPYVHHFNSYSMVKGLQGGGYALDQSITVMKGIRGLLAGNLDVAQASLVSKSDVENETYLFRAACSELSAEIKNNRRLQDEQIRQQRTHLQHEVDNMTQSLNQEALTLNDNVRGLFNDRRMTVREEQKTVESAVQQINYKISIMLTSDAKSEIEAVRWILIRRSVVGILFMAVMTLFTLRYASYVGHEQQREAEQRAKEEEAARRDGGRQDNSAAADAAVILAAS